MILCGCRSDVRMELGEPEIELGTPTITIGKPTFNMQGGAQFRYEQAPSITMPAPRVVIGDPKVCTSALALQYVF